MNIFLTGEVQVGKSTIIQKYLESYTGHTHGFITKKMNDNGQDKIYIFDINDPDKSPKQSNFAALCGNSKIIYKINKPFETIGIKSLQNSNCDLIVMDELGIIEKDALQFQKQVFLALDSNTPVIGVIKPKHSEFLDAIRNRPDVTTLKITQENRDTIVNEFIELMKKNMGI